MHKVRMVGVWVALVAAGAPGVAAGGWRQKGMSLTLWDQTVDLGQLSQSLDDAAAIGVDHVAVNVWWFQENISATTIAADFGLYSASDASVRSVIDAIHSRGMDVMLKPLVDLRNDPTHWRGQIAGGNAWFWDAGGYGDFIYHFAELAADKNVEIFCVGTELVATAAQEADWRSVIAGVRGRYAGELTYAANHGGGAVTAAAIAWWDALDYFGLDAYYPLTDKNDPTLAELQSAWAARGAAIEAWRNGIDPAKDVVLTEVGYRSWDGANRWPYNGADWGDTNVDEQEQADCYEALLSQLWEEGWLAGGYWWNWEVDPTPTWEADNWYPLQGKPAQDVVAGYYVPEPASIALLTVGAILLPPRRRR